MKNFYSFMLSLLTVFAFTTLTQAQTVSNTCGSGSVQDTDGSDWSSASVDATSGTGTAASPAQCNFDVDICFDLLTFQEQLLNWAHGVYFYNLPPGATVTYVSGNQSTANATVAEDHQWVFFDATQAATLGLPSAGFYVDTDDDPLATGTTYDGDPTNNLGDNGNGTGTDVTPESFTLVPFCFNVAFTDCTSTTSWTPGIAVTGDGETGSWAVPAVTCLVAGFVPDSGGPNGDGSVRYGTGEETTGGLCISGSDSQVLVASGSGTGSATAADPYIGEFTTRVCYDLESFSEELLNWAHGVFITNLPDGATVAVGPTGAQPTADGDGADTDADGTIDNRHEWQFFNQAAVDGIGGLTFPGFYVDYYDVPNNPVGAPGGFDGDPTDNFGDGGNGAGAFPFSEVYDGSLHDSGDDNPNSNNLAPFCFDVTIPAGVGEWTPRIALSGDGETGSHLAPAATCLINEAIAANTVYWSEVCPTTKTENDFDIDANGIFLSGTAPSWTATTACELDGAGAGNEFARDLVVYSPDGTATTDHTFAPPAPGYAPDVRIATTSDNPSVLGTGTTVNCASGLFDSQLKCRNTELQVLEYDWLCATPDAELVAPAITNETCTLKVVTYYLPIYDYSNGVYHPTCELPRYDVKIMPAQPTIVSTGDLCTATPMARIQAVDNTICTFAKAMTLQSCTGTAPNATATWTADISALEVATAFGDANAASLYMPLSLTIASSADCDCAVLPAELVDFTAREKGTSNLISWTTEVEENVDKFIVEHSTDGRNFYAIGQRAANNSDRTENYSFEDTKPMPMSYYRLRIVVFDGAEDFSSVLSIERKQDVISISSIQPNPTTANARVLFNMPTHNAVTITVKDVLGRTISAEAIDATKGMNVYNADLSGVNAGLYYIIIEDGNRQVVERLMKN